MIFSIFFIAIIAFILGLLIGIPVTLRLYKAGTLIVDTTDPTTDKYRFEIEKDLNKLPDYKYISLRVKLAVKQQNPMSVTDINKFLMPPYPEETQ